MPHPSRSTLFPYTTLFRSRPDAAIVEDDDLGRHAVAAQRLHLHAGEADRRVAGNVDDRPVGDRKSTRLNSSHLGISYAVFCLKKKKIEEDRRADRTGPTPR